MSRFVKICTSISQFLNVTFLPNPEQTNPNETISGRCYRQNWINWEKRLDRLFFRWEKNHCKESYIRDVRRAKELLEEDFK